MGFQEVQDLDCDVTTALGGRNKQTGKANPTRVEGYFIGSKQTVSKKSKTGFAFLHILQTPKGRLGVWGKTDLDRKMAGVTAGTMVRITQSGTVATPNGEMYKFKVEIDRDNTIDVDLPTPTAVEDAQSDELSGQAMEEEDAMAEASAEEDIPEPARAAPPSRPVAPPDAAKRARVQQLLAGKK
jgi:hypothetical protein